MTISGGNWNTQDAAAARQDMFKKLDADGDGKISKDELKAGLANRPGGDSKGPSIDDLFNRIDTNGDGSIDQSENDTFLQSQSQSKAHGAHGGKGHHGPPDPAKMAQKLFEKADADGDGKVTKAELAAALPKQGGQTNASSSSSSSSNSTSAIDDLFSDADSDGDGSITEAELQAGLEKRLQRFSSYDQNGTVSTSAAGTSRTIGVA